MEVSGKKTEKEKDIDINLCEPCKDDDHTTKADGVCQECKEFMCQTCFKDHLKARVCRNHMFVDSGQFPKSNEEVEDNIKCEKHPTESVRFYCRNHKATGCGDCILLDHKLCAHEYIRDIAKDFPESSEFKAFKEKLDNSVVKVNDRLKATSAKKLLVLELERKAVEIIKQFRKDIDSFLNKAEKESLAKLKECASENNTHLSYYEKKMMSLKSVTEEVKSQVDASRGFALFKTAEEHKEIPDKIAEKVTLADENTYLDVFEFVADTELQKLISKSKPLGYILRKKDSNEVARSLHECLFEYAETFDRKDGAIILHFFREDLNEIANNAVVTKYKESARDISITINYAEKSKLPVRKALDKLRSKISSLFEREFKVPYSKKESLSELCREYKDSKVVLLLPDIDNRKLLIIGKTDRDVREVAQKIMDFFFF